MRSTTGLANNNIPHSSAVHRRLSEEGLHGSLENGGFFFIPSTHTIIINIIIIIIITTVAVVVVIIAVVLYIFGRAGMKRSLVRKRFRPHVVRNNCGPFVVCPGGYGKRSGAPPRVVGFYENKAEIKIKRVIKKF